MQCKPLPTLFVYKKLCGNRKKMGTVIKCSIYGAKKFYVIKPVI